MLRYALKIIFPDQGFFNILRYALAGLWVTLAAPWVLSKWAGRIIPVMQDSKGMTQMRIGLAVTKVTRNTGRNLHAMLEFIDEAARNEADLVLFGEAAPTALSTMMIHATIRPLLNLSRGPYHEYPGSGCNQCRDICWDGDT